MPEPTEPIITAVPTAEELGAQVPEKRSISPDKPTMSELDRVYIDKVKGEKAISDLTSLMIEPESAHMMGNLRKQSVEHILTINESIKSLTPDKALVALNLVKNLPKRHIDWHNENVAHKMIRQSLKKEIYGTDAVGAEVHQQTLGTKEGQKRAAEMPWTGAPIEIGIGNDKVLLSKDDKKGWVYYLPGGNPVEIGKGTKLGRSDFAAKDENVSREHVTFMQNSRGEIQIFDTSLNGTSISTERYPSLEEWKAQQEAVAQPQAEDRQSGARSKLSRLFGRK